MTNRFGELLETERDRRDMTLTDFAREVLGLDHGMVSRYVNGVSQPGRRTVRKIAAALGVEVAEIDAMLAEADAARRGAHRPGLGPTGQASEQAASYVVSTPAATVRLEDPRLVGRFFGFLSRWERMTEEEKESLAADDLDLPDPPRSARGEGDAEGGASGAGGSGGPGL